MLRSIPPSWAVRGLLALQATSLGYHALILSGVVPYENVWGGRLTSHEQMLRFEAVSVALNLGMVWIVGMVGGLWKRVLRPRVLTMICYVFAGLFALNTLGNLAATTTFETVVFTPLTLLACIGFARLAVGEVSAPG